MEFDDSWPFRVDEVLLIDDDVVFLRSDRSARSLQERIVIGCEDVRPREIEQRYV